MYSALLSAAVGDGVSTELGGSELLGAAVCWLRSLCQEQQQCERWHVPAQESFILAAALGVSTAVWHQEQQQQQRDQRGEGRHGYRRTYIPKC